MQKTSELFCISKVYTYEKKKVVTIQFDVIIENFELLFSCMRPTRVILEGVGNFLVYFNVYFNLHHLTYYIKLKIILKISK